MNQDLIHSFRNKINDKELIFHIFRNRFGRNKWSVICSAIDWIEVTVGEIDLSKLSRNNDNQSSIKMLTFISCIDVMWEAIQQLHRVLFDTDNIPFQNDYSVFQQTVSDNVYFKTIRACFAAHPINLQEVYPDDEKEERWFASWSGGTFSGRDFSVILYSNNPKKESRFFDVSFKEIYEFAGKRYNYLAVLMKQSDFIINNYLDSFRNMPIKIGDEVLGNIKVLLEENKMRFENDYFNYELEKMQKVFSVNIRATKSNTLALELYKNALRLELDEIKDRLQNMKLEELNSQVSDDVPMEIHYSFSKLSDAVWQNEYCMMFNYVVTEMQRFFSGVVDIDIDMTQEEVYVLGCAGAYLMNN